jgi:hypothetical protein
MKKNIIVNWIVIGGDELFGKEVGKKSRKDFADFLMP